MADCHTRTVLGMLPACDASDVYSRVSQVAVIHSTFVCYQAVLSSRVVVQMSASCYCVTYTTYTTHTLRCGRVVKKQEASSRMSYF